MVIIRRHIDDRQRNTVSVDMHPGAGIGPCPKPVPVIEPVPKATVEIEALLIGNHVNIAISTGNHHDIGRFLKYNRRGKPD